MREKYNNLILALAQFAEDMWIPYEDSIGSIEVSAKGGMIDKEKLIREFDSALLDDDLNWVQLATESELFISLDEYENAELKEHVQNLLTLYLHPELELTSEVMSSLEEKILSILESKSNKNEDWVSSKELLSIIRDSPQFSEVANYHIWDFFLKRVLYNKVKVERKPIEGKERSVGYFRYKKN